MEILPVKNHLMNGMTYVVYSHDVDYSILIDCGEYETLQSELYRIGKTVKAVLLTHGHSDHIAGLNELLQRNPSVTVYSNEYGHLEIGNAKKNHSHFAGYPFEVKNYQKKVITDGDVLDFEGLCKVKVLWTPGHDESCMSYQIGDCLFTGDAYIPGLKVFTKFPGAKKEQAIQSEDRLKRLENEGYQIFCGHHSYDIKYNK